MIQAHLIGNLIYSKSEDSFSLYEKSLFGEKKSGRVEYSNIEVLYLLEKQKIVILKNKKNVLFDVLLKRLKKLDKRIEIKYSVFKDLRDKGYLVKTALKYGADFRVYEKGVKPSMDHAKWVLFAINENSPFNAQDFVAKNRIAHSVNKKLLIAVVDDEFDVSYYEVGWVKV